ncbi:MAG: hypothetical protein ACKPHU_21290, partial [Planctomycetaceae bacterium]
MRTKSEKLRTTAIREFIDCLTEICDDLTFEGGGGRKDRASHGSAGSGTSSSRAAAADKRRDNGLKWENIDCRNWPVNELIAPLLGDSGGEIRKAMQDVLEEAVAKKGTRARAARRIS